MLPEPPWRTHPAIAATGLNAELLRSFHNPAALHDGCRPLGIDTTLWDPPGTLTWSGFIFISRYGTSAVPSAEQHRKRGDRSVTEWSDGSISANVVLGDGTYRFQIDIPVDRSGTPGDRCTYIYVPSTPDETGKEIVRSLRFIEQASTEQRNDAGTRSTVRSGLPSA